MSHVAFNRFLLICLCIVSLCKVHAQDGHTYFVCKKNFFTLDSLRLGYSNFYFYKDTRKELMDCMDEEIFQIETIGKNLIPNGDFSSKMIDFQTDYKPYEVGDFMFYFFSDDSIKDYNPIWSNCYTSSKNRYFVFSSDYDTTHPPPKILSYTFVTENNKEQYLFSFDATSLFGVNFAIFQVLLNDEPIGYFQLDPSSLNCNWKTQFLRFEANQGINNIAITELNRRFIGLDIGIDNIALYKTTFSEEAINEHATLYPNPASETANLVFNMPPNGNDYYIKMVDNSGRELPVIISNDEEILGNKIKKTIKVSQLRTGIYYIGIEMNGYIEFLKLIKI